MSGKKSSEVAAVLKRAEKTRAATEANYNRSVTGHLQKIRECGEQIKQLEKELAGIQCVISQTADAELSSEAESLRNEWNKTNKDFTVASNVKSLEKQLADKKATYDAELHQLDEQADNIRRIIRSKSWYCDEEYREAERIHHELKQLNNNKNAFLQEMEMAERKISEAEIRLKRLYEQKLLLTERINELNQRADDIASLRQEAQKAKSCVKQMFGKIDSAIAGKFMAAEYGTLQSEMSEYDKLNDADAVQKLQQIMEHISDFNSRLDAAYSAWKEAKERTEQFLHKTDALLSEGKYYHPKDYLVLQEKACSMTLFAFLAEYSDNSYEQQYEQIMKQARELFQAECFDESCKMLSEATEIIHKASEYAGTLQNQLIGSFQLAVDSRDIMMNLGYQVKTKFLNGKNAADGFRVTCTMGDEIIDFEKVMVDADGKVTLNIDHTEGEKSCGSTWKVLKDALNENGIPMTDVKKNGNSVIYSGGQGQRNDNDGRKKTNG